MRHRPLPINHILRIPRPGQRPRIRPRKRRQLPWRRSLLRLRHKHIRIIHPVRIRLRLVAHKRHHRSVRAPHPVLLPIRSVPIHRPIRQLRQLLRRHIKQIKMRLLIRKKSHPVFLIVIPVDHNRLRRRRLRPYPAAAHPAPAASAAVSSSPETTVSLNLLLHIRQLLRLASAPVQHPNLLPLRRARALRLAPRRKRQPLPIRAPLRIPATILAHTSAQFRLPIPAHHPQLARVLVPLRIHPAHRVRHPRPSGDTTGAPTRAIFTRSSGVSPMLRRNRLRRHHLHQAADTKRKHAAHQGRRTKRDLIPHSRECSTSPPPPNSSAPLQPSPTISRRFTRGHSLSITLYITVSRRRPASCSA